MRVRPEHWQLLLELCENNPEVITNKFNGPEGKTKLNVLWQNNVIQLNSLGFGDQSIEGWRKALVDWKSNTKAKAAAIKRDLHITGGGPPEYPQLLPWEEKLLKIMGLTAIEGNREVPELGFGQVNTLKKTEEENLNDENPQLEMSGSSAIKQDHNYISTSNFLESPTETLIRQNKKKSFK